MKKVPQEILDKAKKCPFDYACIKDPDNHEQCVKKYKLLDNLVAVSPKAEIDVDNDPYVVSLPESKIYYCLCPVYSYLN